MFDSLWRPLEHGGSGIPWKRGRTPATDASTVQSKYTCYTWIVPQLNFYVPEDSARLLRQRARQKGLSLSKYLASLVLRDMGSSWPRGYFENAVGFWEGEFERPTQGRLERREKL